MFDYILLGFACPNFPKTFFLKNINVCEHLVLQTITINVKFLPYAVSSK